jgi:very-short-patch-repair endonuclease
VGGRASRDRCLFLICRRKIASNHSADIVEAHNMLNERARDLRRNMTEAEHVLWSRLRRRQLRGARFRRQMVLGSYIVDFVCVEQRLIIELDGGQHTLQRDYDDRRTNWLNSQNFRVLRFWNSDVLEELDVVLEAIWNALEPQQR